MTNHKLQQIMADKKTPKTEADNAGMSNLLSQVREKREQATGVNESFTLLVQVENPHTGD